MPLKKDSGFDPRSGNFSKNRLACVRAVVEAVSKEDNTKGVPGNNKAIWSLNCCFAFSRVFA